MISEYPFCLIFLSSFNYIYNDLAPIVRMKIKKRDLTKYLLLFLLPAVLWLFINATVNKHNHFLSEGYIISHAHPYDKTPSNPDPLDPHHHNGLELFLLSLVSDPLTTTSIVFLLVFFLLAVMLTCKHRYDIIVPIQRLYQVRNYHAPPGF